MEPIFDDTYVVRSRTVKIIDGEEYLEFLLYSGDVIRIPLRDIFTASEMPDVTKRANYMYNTYNWTTNTNEIAYDTDWRMYATTGVLTFNGSNAGNCVVNFNFKPDKPNDVADEDINDEEFMDILNS